MTLPKILSNRPIQIISLALAIVLFASSPAQACTYTITRKGSNWKCIVHFMDTPRKAFNKAYTNGFISCERTSRVAIRQQLQQLSLLGAWNTIYDSDWATGATYAEAAAAADCRYGTKTTWRSINQFVVNGTYKYTFKVTRTTLACDV